VDGETITSLCMLAAVIVGGYLLRRTIVSLCVLAAVIVGVYFVRKSARAKAGS